jgi:transcription antitermination factor NusG
MNGEMKPMKVLGYLKKNVKVWHDKKIIKRDFKVGDQVFLFNSHFKYSAGKLKSK